MSLRATQNDPTINNNISDCCNCIVMMGDILHHLLRENVEHYIMEYSTVKKKLNYIILVPPSHELLDLKPLHTLAQNTTPTCCLLCLVRLLR